MMTDAVKCCVPNLPLSPSIFRNSHLEFFVNPTPSQVPAIRKRPMTPVFATRGQKFRGQRMASSERYGGLVGVRCAASDGEDGNGDEFYMRRCVELARKAVGCTSPNPMVGCVIVKDGKIVGEGFHPKAGQPHAEVFALRDAGGLAENATAYVSLEPCNHYGRTPPCTEALIKAKVKKVVVGMVDPNPKVDSKGVDRLRAAGVEVRVGIEEELCKKLNEPFIHCMLTGKPFVCLRYSISINGHFSSGLGPGAAEVGGYYSKLLQEYDAVLLPSTSLTEKSLFLTSQEPGANQPLRIVIARGPDIAVDLPVLTADDSKCKVIVLTDGAGVGSKSSASGIETVVLKKMSLDVILDYCKSRGLLSLLIDWSEDLSEYEELLREGIKRNSLQKIIVEVLPILTEGDEGNASAAGVRLGMSNRIKLKEVKAVACNGSVILESYI
ncbi:hypothetical protein MLD38_028500 [Melastoma candidum]|uniref:Uncharacterized protein n=1 Tax=Melastoma candidum TaxID=119954 RepID=A0ACB9N2J0_9MYRT|nr:hypothetical protein MLD38_028500 [Melastoma candidum]